MDNTIESRPIELPRTLLVIDAVWCLVGVALAYFWSPLYGNIGCGALQFLLLWPVVALLLWIFTAFKLPDNWRGWWVLLLPVQASLAFLAFWTLSDLGPRYRIPIPDDAEVIEVFRANEEAFTELAVSLLAARRIGTLPQNTLTAADVELGIGPPGREQRLAELFEATGALKVFAGRQSVSIERFRWYKGKGALGYDLVSKSLCYYEPGAERDASADRVEPIDELWQLEVTVR